MRVNLCRFLFLLLIFLFGSEQVLAETTLFVNKQGYVTRATFEDPGTGQIITADRFTPPVEPTLGLYPPEKEDPKRPGVPLDPDRLLQRYHLHKLLSDPTYAPLLQKNGQNLLQFKAEDVIARYEDKIAALQIPENPNLEAQLRNLAEAFSLYADPKTMKGVTDGVPRNTIDLALNIVTLFGPNGKLAIRAQKGEANTCFFFHDPEGKLLAYSVLASAADGPAGPGEGEFAFVATAECRKTHQWSAIAKFMTDVYAPYVSGHSEWALFHDAPLSALFASSSFDCPKYIQLLRQLGFEAAPVPSDGLSLKFAPLPPKDIEKKVKQKLRDQFAVHLSSEPERIQAIVNKPFKLQVGGQILTGVLRTWKTAGPNVVSLKTLFLKPVAPTGLESVKIVQV